jgi:hypothetical protein
MNYQMICETMIASILADSHRKSLATYNDAPKEKRMPLAIAAQILIQSSQWIVDNGYSMKKADFFKAASAELQAQNIQYLPKSHREFQAAVKRFREEGILPSLPRTGLKNASKAELGFDILQGVATRLRAMEKNFTNEHIIRKLKEWCDKENELRTERGESALAMPSKSWFHDFFAKIETRHVTVSRHGDGRHSKQYGSYIPLERPLHADDCWQCDGTRVNFIPYYTNEKTKSGAKKELYLYVVVVRDLYSGSIRGIAFCQSESHESYRFALDTAIQSTNRLPYEIVFDRFPGHDSLEWKAIDARLRDFGVKTEYSAHANRKAALERWFSTIQSVFYQNLPSFYGEGIQSTRPFAHRSSKYITTAKKEARKSGRSYSDAVNECEWCMVQHESTPYNKWSQVRKSETRSPSQVYDDEFAPASISIRIEQRLWIFGEHRELQIRRGFVTCMVDSVSYQYRVEMELEMKYESVILIHTSDADFDVARLYTVSGEYLGVVEAVTRIQTYGKAGEDGRKQLGEAKAKVSARETQRKFRLKELLSKAGDYEDIDEATLLSSYHAPKQEQERAESGASAAMARLPEPISDNGDNDDNDDEDENFRNLY